MVALKRSIRIGVAHDLLIRSYDLAAIMRAGGWSDPSTVSRYCNFNSITCGNSNSISHSHLSDASAMHQLSCVQVMIVLVPNPIRRS